MANVLKIDILSHISENHIKVGDQLVFKATLRDLNDFQSDSIKSKLKIISVVPSLDTAICKKQATILDREVSKLQADQVKLYTISKDLPFASMRICKTEITVQHLILSDYRYSDFSNKTGLNIPDYNFLCRAILLLDVNNKVIYIQISKNLKTPIDYSTVLSFMKNYVANGYSLKS